MFQLLLDSYKNAIVEIDKAVTPSNLNKGASCRGGRIPSHQFSFACEEMLTCLYLLHLTGSHADPKLAIAFKVPVDCLEGFLPVSFNLRRGLFVFLLNASRPRRLLGPLGSTAAKDQRGKRSERNYSHGNPQGCRYDIPTTLTSKQWVIAYEVRTADEALAPLRDDIPNRDPKLASLSGDLMIEFVQHLLSRHWVFHQILIDRSFNS